MTELGPGELGHRPFVLCADDYGITPGVSSAIRQLLELRRLSATSCMTQSPYWSMEARSLDPDLDADIGLHLTLTDQVPAGHSSLAPNGRLPSLGILWRKLVGDADARRAAIDELQRQVDRFVAALGRYPDFIDGHQHVHLLPHVRDAVIMLATRISRERPIYVRICADPFHQIVRRRVAVGKALLLAAMSQPLRRLAERAGIPTNDSFRGVSTFDARSEYAHEFHRFLLGPGRRPLIMCHPGMPDRHLAELDTLVDRRADEFRYLSGDAFPADLFRARARIARFSQLPTGSRP